VLELFGGIGACSKALENLGIDYEITDYVEIDKYATKSFNAIHGTNFDPQDITMWNKDIYVDLIMHGSPCQDFSIAGKQAGGNKNSGTRSSLMYETIRIVEKLQPKYVIWENVKNLLSKKHKHNFDAYLKTMEQLGYNNYYQILNAKDYGIPQNRERVFTVSIRKDIDKGFVFPEKQPLKLKLKDMLENEVDEKYYLSEKQINRIKNSNYNQNKRRIQEKDYCDTLCARDYKDPKVVEVFDFCYDEGVRFRKDKDLSPCLTCKVGSSDCSGQPLLNVNNVTEWNLRIRRLTPKECWRLMGFDDADFEKACKVNSNSQLYKQGEIP
jgi:DNA (cytosine-5)-methyltransferase 1